MNTVTEFKTSLKGGKPDPDCPLQLKSLWFDGKGDWQMAHQTSITLATVNQLGYMLTCTEKKETLGMLIIGIEKQVKFGPMLTWQRNGRLW